MTDKCPMYLLPEGEPKFGKCACGATFEEHTDRHFTAGSKQKYVELVKKAEG